VLAQTSPKPNRGGADTLYDKLGDTGSGGAAPRHDLTGFWAGQVAAKLNEVAPLTPWGQEQFRLHKNNGSSPFRNQMTLSRGATRWGSHATCFS